MSLNSRISRLAIGLGVPLALNEDVEAALNNALIGDQGLASSGVREGQPKRRERMQHAELRALLVMRYSMAQRCVARYGPEIAREMLNQTEIQMQRLGFAEGSDGVQLNRLDFPS